MSQVLGRRPMAHEILWNNTRGKPWLFVHGAYFARGPAFLLVPTNQYMKRVWKEYHERVKVLNAARGSDYATSDASKDA